MFKLCTPLTAIAAVAGESHRTRALDEVQFFVAITARAAWIIVARTVI